MKNDFNQLENSGPNRWKNIGPYDTNDPKSLEYDPKESSPL